MKAKGVSISIETAVTTHTVRCPRRKRPLVHRVGVAGKRRRRQHTTAHTSFPSQINEGFVCFGVILSFQNKEKWHMPEDIDLCRFRIYHQTLREAEEGLSAKKQFNPNSSHGPTTRLIK